MTLNNEDNSANLMTIAGNWLPRLGHAGKNGAQVELTADNQTPDRCHHGGQHFHPGPDAENGPTLPDLNIVETRGGTAVENNAVVTIGAGAPGP